MKGEAKSINEVNDVNIFEYHNGYWSVIQVQNNSKKDLNLKINCSKSENCISNQRDLVKDLKVKSMKSKIALFLTASNQNKEWIVKCNYAVE